MQSPGFLEYKNYRYLKISGLLTGVALIGYWLTQPAGGHAYGGTWYGYFLGISSALIILLHAWYGIHKRRPPKVLNRRLNDRRKMFAEKSSYAANRRKRDLRQRSADKTWRHGATLQGWLSAHTHLGFALFVMVTLHTGFRLGWNVHSLAYVLLLLVMTSGVYGALAYLHYPRQVTRNGGDGNLDEITTQIARLDEQLKARAGNLPVEVQQLVEKSRQETLTGGSLRQRLTVRYPDCPTAIVADKVRELGEHLILIFHLFLFSVVLNTQNNNQSPTRFKMNCKDKEVKLFLPNVWR